MGIYSALTLILDTFGLPHNYIHPGETFEYMNVKCYTQMFRYKLYFSKDKKKVYCGLGTIMATFTITHHDAILNFMEL